MFGSWLGGWTTEQATINERGVYTDVVVGDRAIHTSTWGDLKSSNNSVGLNLEWDVTDTLRLELDVMIRRQILGATY